MFVIDDIVRCDVNDYCYCYYCVIAIVSAIVVSHSNRGGDSNTCSGCGYLYDHYHIVNVTIVCND